MSMPINRAAFEQLIAEDIAWLGRVAPDTLERRHIVLCLKEQARLTYEAHPATPVIDAERQAWARLVVVSGNPAAFEGDAIGAAKQALRDLGVDVDGLLRKS